MNQFRDILICVLIAFSIALLVGHPEDWTWPAAGGAYCVQAISFMTEGRPWSVIVMVAVALALFMTRLKY